MSAPTAPPDARFRPFRGAAWALYLVMAVGYSALVIFSVTKSVASMSPGHPEAGQARSRAECVDGARRLFDELRSARAELSTHHVTEAEGRWLVFRNGWIVRLRNLEAACALTERPDVRRAFLALDQVMDHATVEATQLSGQLGPAIDAFEAASKALDAPP